MNQRTVVICLLATAMIAAGCGGGSSGSSLSKPRFIQLADALCEETREEIARRYQLAAEANPGPDGRPRATPEALIESAALPPVRKQAQTLTGLNPPEAEDVHAVVEMIEEVVDDLESDPRLALSGAGRPFAKAERVARQYGFRVCGQF